MPFKSQQELQSMQESDPKKAAFLVAKAKQMGRPVVSKNNPGYSKDAVARRMAKQQQPKQKPQQQRQQSGNADEHDYREMERREIAGRNKSSY
jgi:hypothetical protein